MSDGPFKNLKLGRRWKRFAEAVQNDASTSAECSAFAMNALLHEILTQDVKALLTDLRNCANQEQLNLAPSATVEEIFRRHQKSSFADTLQKEVVFRLRDKMPLADAIKQAVEAAVTEQKCEAKSRIVEECILSRDYKGMGQDQFNRTVKETSAIFNGLATSEICEAILAGNINTFKAAISKRRGLDEGVSL